MSAAAVEQRRTVRRANDRAFPWLSILVAVFTFLAGLLGGELAFSSRVAVLENEYQSIKTLEQDVRELHTSVEALSVALAAANHHP